MHAGKCEQEIAKICDKDLEQGEGRLAACISDAITDGEAGTEGAQQGNPWKGGPQASPLWKGGGAGTRREGSKDAQRPARRNILVNGGEGETKARLLSSWTALYLSDVVPQSSRQTVAPLHPFHRPASPAAIQRYALPLFYFPHTLFPTQDVPLPFSQAPFLSLSPNASPPPPVPPLRCPGGVGRMQGASLPVQHCPQHQHQRKHPARWVTNLPRTHAYRRGGSSCTLWSLP